MEDCILLIWKHFQIQTLKIKKCYITTHSNSCEDSRFRKIRLALRVIIYSLSRVTHQLHFFGPLIMDRIVRSASIVTMDSRFESTLQPGKPHGNQNKPMIYSNDNIRGGTVPNP